MSIIQIIRLLNVPELLGFADTGLDDMDMDANGNAYISDGLNRRIYKVLTEEASSDPIDISSAISLCQEGECCLNLSVASDSAFYVVDPVREVVVRYDGSGNSMGEFYTPGVLSLCCGPENLIYVLLDDEGTERINSYDDFGFQIGSLAAPPRPRKGIDCSLTKIAADPEGNVYVTYGMPPYSIWKVNADGSGIDTWSKEFDHPEDAVLIADIAFDASAGILWALLAYKHFGQQILDAFTPEGEHLGSVEIPHTVNLYSEICSTGNSHLYLLDTGSGDLVQILATV